jgi:hypothetical protein
MHAMDADNPIDPATVAILLHQFEHSFLAVANEIRNDPEINDDIKKSVDQKANEFKRHFRMILAFHAEQRKTAFDALRSAFSLGALMAMRPQVLNGVIRILNDARTQPARKARRKDNFQEIIERNARKLWKRKPSFEGNNEGTANEIYTLVIKEVNALDRIPKGWKINDPADSNEKNRAIGRISKRISRIR